MPARSRHCIWELTAVYHCMGYGKVPLTMTMSQETCQDSYTCNLRGWEGVWQTLRVRNDIVAIQASSV